MNAHSVIDEVWVWLPRDRDGHLLPAASGLLYEGRDAARRLGAGLTALSAGVPDPTETERLAHWEVRSVYTWEEHFPPHPLGLAGMSLTRALGEGGRPRLVLFPADTAGTVLAPRLVTELDALFVPGCTGVTVNGNRMVASRPALGAQYEARVTADLDTPLVVTLLPDALGDPRQPAGRTPLVLPTVRRIPAGEAPPMEPPRFFPPDPDTLHIQDAERIVAFGRGAFSADARALVQRLARALGATVAGTRPAADEGWLPFSRQIGLTGALVTPRLYVAVGISGAPYHLVGVKDPETLIAINADPEAPIFASAHLGIVGDLHTVLPALLDRLERGEGLPGIGTPGPAPGRTGDSP